MPVVAGFASDKNEYELKNMGFSTAFMKNEKYKSEGKISNLFFTFTKITIIWLPYVSYKLCSLNKI